MVQISKTESILLYKVYPMAEITKTRHRRYAPEEKRYLVLLSENENDEAKSILQERYGTTWNKKF